MELIQLFVLIQRDGHVLHMLAGKNDKPMISETLRVLRVINVVKEWKYPINICTLNTDDN